jgi:uncharacterized LabA/DUF88 family protein
MAKPLFAVLVDGGFVTKKLYERLGRQPNADDIEALTYGIQCAGPLTGYELLRVYYYDAPPSSESVKRPISGTRLELASTERYRSSQSLHAQLAFKPHFALRMGETRLSPNKWRIKPRTARDLQKAPRPLVDGDFDLDLTQKGVDMRIGLDMARLALRDTVRIVVVVTGDGDFVPAFKFVRREGIRVYLETLGHNVNPSLREHADLMLEAPLPRPAAS